ncbi:SAM-dependent methyltransferase [Streptomyces sp. NPDC001739]
MIYSESGVKIVRRALRGGTELTTHGHNELINHSLVSTFFESDLAATYFPQEYSNWESDWIVSVAAQYGADNREMRVLDVCSGFGRIALKLAQKGNCHVDAIDISIPGAAALASKSRELNLDSVISVFVADAANFARLNYYDFAVSAENSLRYLVTESRVRRNMQLVGQSLQSHGAYLIHIALDPESGSTTWVGDDGRKVEWSIEETNSLANETVERVRVTDSVTGESHVDLQTQLLLDGVALTRCVEQSGLKAIKAWTDGRVPLALSEIAEFRGNCWCLLVKGSVAG